MVSSCPTIPRIRADPGGAAGLDNGVGCRPTMSSGRVARLGFYVAWTKARPANDFTAMWPYLEKNVELSRYGFYRRRPGMSPIR